MNEDLGSCACGTVSFRLDSPLIRLLNCHCTQCRKHNGASFSSYAIFPYNSLSITKGKACISVYTEDSGKKHFCEKCGTPLFNQNEKYPGICMVFLGTLRSRNDYVPDQNIWCENKLSWVDNLPNIPNKLKDS